MLKINKKKYNLLALCKSIRDRSLSPIDIAEKVIENYSNTKSSLNAYREFDPDKILNQAKIINKKFNKNIDCGKLMGIPISVKDLFGVNGYKTYAGTPKALPIKWEKEGPIIKNTQKQLLSHAILQQHFPLMCFVRDLMFQLLVWSQQLNQL